MMDETTAAAFLPADAPLAISAVAEVLYCPKNAWYRLADRSRDANAAVIRGTLQDSARDDRLTRADAGRTARRQVDVSSAALGIQGRVDVLEERGGIWPVEYKSGVDRRAVNDAVQLCAYGICLEETLDRSVPWGFLYYGATGRRRKVEFTPELGRLVKDTVARTRAILSTQEVPAGVNDARCPGCALFQRCMPWTAEGSNVPVDPARVFSERAERQSLVVDRPGAWVGKDGERFSVTFQRKPLAEASAHKVDSITLVGNVNMSSAALRLAWDEAIMVHHLSGGGTYLGAYVPGTADGAAVRRWQYRLAEDPDASQRLAQRFVAGKAENQRRLLVRWARRKVPDVVRDTLRSAARRITATAKGIARVQDADALRGVEGAIARAYFMGLAAYIEDSAPPGADWFTGRNRRPPRDPVNAALSFGYAMLLRDAVTACRIAGLDPYVGVFHTEAWGRPSLALDLCEEFRPVLVDRLIASLFRIGTLQADHDFEAVPGGWYLSAAGRSALYQAWDAQRRKELIHPLYGFRVTYRRAMEIQARLLAKAITRETPSYPPFVSRT